MFTVVCVCYFKYSSTSVSNKQSLIVYIRVIFDDTVCTYFLGLLPLTMASAAAILI